MNLSCLLLLLVTLGPSAPAAVTARRGAALFSLTGPGFESWRLAVEGRSFLQSQMADADAGWARLWATGLQLGSLSIERAAVLAESIETGGKRPQWLLLDGSGRIQAWGLGLPSLPQVEEGLRKQLGTLPWDRVASLLRAHPDHGEACLAQAEFALAAATPWSFRDTRPMLRFEEVTATALAAMEQLVAIPDWPWQVELTAAVQPAPWQPSAAPGAAPLAATRSAGAADAVPAPVSLGNRLLQQQGRYQGLLQRMSKQVIAALASDPANLRLQTSMAFFLRSLDRESGERAMGELSQIDPLPGQSWPPLPLIHAMADFYGRQGRWPDLLSQTHAWSRPVDRLFLDAQAWDRQVQRQGTLRAYAAKARSWQEGWTSLSGALAELRREGGSHYPELARLALLGAYLPKRPSKDLEDLVRQAALPPQAAPAMPEPLPLWRLNLRDPLDRNILKASFERNPRLDQWLPSEYLLALQPGLARSWQASLGVEVRAEGEGLPLPETLGDLFAAGRPGRLWSVSDRVALQPEAPGPRRLRGSLLLKRLPCRGLESLLAEDLVQALLGAEEAMKDPDENLWFAEARRAIPALEEHLQRWPMDGDRWAALAFWTSFLPAHRGPIDLAETLPTLQPGLAFQLCLPAEVHAQVGRQLQQRNAWVALRAWCEPVRAQLAALDPGSNLGRILTRELAPTILTLLDSAYAGLGLAGERQALREAGRELAQPTSNPMGR